MRLDQHRPAEAAADADRGNAALAFSAPERMQQMQHDSRTRRAHRVAERDGAAVSVELFDVELTHRAVETQFLTAVLVFFPCREAAEHLGRERFVDFPSIEVVELQSVALEYPCRR